MGDAEQGAHTIHTARRGDTGWKLAPAPLPEGAPGGGSWGWTEGSGTLPFAIRGF